LLGIGGRGMGKVDKQPEARWTGGEEKEKKVKKKKRKEKQGKSQLTL